MHIERRNLPWQKVNGQVVAIVPENNETVEFNEVATDIWELLQAGPISSMEIVESLSEVYEVGRVELTADVDAFLKQLAEKDMVSFTDG